MIQALIFRQLFLDMNIIYTICSYSAIYNFKKCIRVFFIRTNANDIGALASAQNVTHKFSRNSNSSETIYKYARKVE